MSTRLVLSKSKYKCRTDRSASMIPKIEKAVRAPDWLIQLPTNHSPGRYVLRGLLTFFRASVYQN